MDTKLVIVQMSQMRVIQPLEIPAALDCQADEAFSSEILGRLLPEQASQTPEELGVEMTCLCLEGACLSIWVGCGVGLWCGGVEGVHRTEEQECFVLTEPCCLPGSEVTFCR